MHYPDQSSPRRQRGALPLAAILLIVGAVALILFAVFFLPGSPEPVPAPGAVVPVTTPQERGDSARDLIEELQSAPGGTDYAEAYGKAREFQQAGQLADAQLLLFFAARGNHAPAAFDLATLYDPTRFAADKTVLEQPDPFQAFKWYTQARDAGNALAAQRLTELRSWAEKAAAAGDDEAQRLLLQWK